MAVIGRLSVIWCEMACRAGLRRDNAPFLCAMLDLATYFVTSVSLALRFPIPMPERQGLL